jgi:hypothetical protein
MGAMGVKRFLLFTAPAAGERKQFVASFETREAGVDVARKLECDRHMRWQVIDSDSTKVVAEHGGSEQPAAPSLPQ